MNSSCTVGYIGMTHLGLVSAIAAAARGASNQINIIGYHYEGVESLNDGVLPIVEPDLADLLRINKNNIFFTSEAKHLKKCDIVYVAPDIPTNDKAESDVTLVENLVNKILPHLSQTCIVVILSQVHPGFTRSLETKYSTVLKGRLFYQVETLIFGCAVERAMYPERFIVGTSKKDIKLPHVLQKFLAIFECPLFVMIYESAELAKISINMYLVSTVTTTNMLAEVCEKIGADWNDIAETLRLDKRIGPYSYLSPGLGLSGGNLERDLATILQMSGENGNNSMLVKAWIDDHEYRADWALRKLHENLLITKQAPTIAVWGLSYKINTHSIKNSPSLRLLRNLKSFKLNAYDPVVKELQGYDHVTICESALDACQGADILVIMTPWDDFKSFSIRDVESVLKKEKTVIIDPYQVFDDSNKINNIQHIVLGKINKYAA